MVKDFFEKIEVKVFLIEYEEKFAKIKSKADKIAFFNEENRKILDLKTKYEENEKKNYKLLVELYNKCAALHKVGGML